MRLALTDTDKTPVFSWFWLKDHGQDEASLNQDTLQRKVDTFSISNDISPKSVSFDSELQLINIAWNESETTSVNAGLLLGVIHQNAQPHQLRPDLPRQTIESSSGANELPTVDFSGVMNTEKGLYEWLSNIAVFGFSIVDGVPTNEADTQAMAERIGTVQNTIFGDMWLLSAELNEHEDTAYSNSFLEPHTDATFYHEAPGLQMFNCFEYQATGGESLLVDGNAIVNQLKQEHPNEFDILCNVDVPGHYIEPGVHLHTQRPAIRLDERSDLLQLSFNNYDRAPFLLDGESMDQFYRAYGLLHTLVNDQQNWLKIPLRPGMTLIFDNWRMLHGRMAYKGKRVFYGCYHSRSVFESQLRHLQTQFNKG